MLLRPSAVQREKKRKAHDKSNDALSKIGHGVEAIASSSNVGSLMKVIRSCKTALESLFTKLEDAVPGTAKYRFYEKRIEENTQMLEKAQASMNLTL